MIVAIRKFLQLRTKSPSLRSKQVITGAAPQTKTRRLLKVQFRSNICTNLTRQYFIITKNTIFGGRGVGITVHVTSQLLKYLKVRLKFACSVLLARSAQNKRLDYSCERKYRSPIKLSALALCSEPIGRSNVAFSHSVSLIYTT